jgi:cytochrome b561
VKLLNTQSSYGFVSLALHWVIVFAIVGQWALAESERVPLHQSIGIVILMLAVVRLAWRAFNPKPAWPVDMKPYEITLARIVHVAFYVLLFTIPLSGWALGSVEDEPLTFFGWFELPRFVVGSEDTIEEVHEVLFNVLMGLAVLHVLGAIKHWIALRGALSGKRA